MLLSVFALYAVLRWQRGGVELMDADWGRVTLMDGAVVGLALLAGFYILYVSLQMEVVSLPVPRLYVPVLLGPYK